MRKAEKQVELARHAYMDQAREDIEERNPVELCETSC